MMLSASYRESFSSIQCSARQPASANGSSGADEGSKPKAANVSASCGDSGACTNRVPPPVGCGKAMLRRWEERGVGRECGRTWRTGGAWNSEKNTREQRYVKTRKEMLT